MTPDDLERLRQPRAGWRPDMRCADCWGAPSCPQLHDTLWDQVWLSAEPKALRQCNCEEWDQQGVRSPKGLRLTSGHWRMCDIARAPGRRALLCLECAEVRLGREIGLLDLMPCLGNYHAFAAVQRLANLVADRVSQLPPEQRLGASRDDIVADLCGLPRRRTFDQLIADSSLGRGLARIAAGDLEGELKQHEACPRGVRREGRHAWRPLTAAQFRELPSAEAQALVVERCECGATR